jgi:thymidylate kinase
LLSTPPSQLLPFRSYFDAQSESTRRAFYNLGNLIVSFELKNQQNTISILDRYWPSTIAYQLARVDEDKQINISWPNYLVQPSLIAYIYVDEIERCRRVAQRSIPITIEEKQLAEQEAFRRRLDFIYRNHIPSSGVHVIDGNRSTSVIANDILSLFQE